MPDQQGGNKMILNFFFTVLIFFRNLRRTQNSVRIWLKNERKEHYPVWLCLIQMAREEQRHALEGRARYLTNKWQKKTKQWSEVGELIVSPVQEQQQPHGGTSRSSRKWQRFNNVLKTNSKAISSQRWKKIRDAAREKFLVGGWHQEAVLRMMKLCGFCHHRS